MAPGKGKLFTCWEMTCCKNFANRRKKDKHEKSFNHKPVKRRHKQTLFDELEKNIIVQHLDTLRNPNLKVTLIVMWKIVPNRNCKRNKKLTIKYVNVMGKDLSKNWTRTTMLKANMKMTQLMFIQMQMKF